MRRVVVVFFVLLLLFSFEAEAKRKKKKHRKVDKETQEWRYEIECMGVGVQGTYLLKVWSYSRNPEVAIEQAKKNAVHGVIFKGFSGNRERGCRTASPLVNNPNIEVEKKDFFVQFFADGGKYMKFISLTADGAVAASDRLKISRKEYKIGVVVSVRKDELRKDLEAAGIIKGLGFGF